MSNPRINELLDQIRDFRDKREWSDIQSVKDLLIGLNIEVSELQALFLWKSEADIQQIVERKELKDEVAFELADIFIFLVYISDKINVDLASSIVEKLKIHELHYPSESSKGNTTKYTKLKDENTR